MPKICPYYTFWGYSKLTYRLNKTTFIAAHRLSAVQYADHILVLEKGCIVEQGSHQELIDMKGFYYKTYQHQLLESAILEGEVSEK